MHPQQREPDPSEGRTAAKRRRITDAALTLFLRHGYGKTSMDQIAADAGVSKQTVYKQFSDKESLFRAIAGGVTANSDQIIDELTETAAAPVDSVDDLREVLRRLAKRYLDGVLEPHVLALRRLMIAEADQFPDLSDEYYRWAQVRGMELVESALRRWAEQGLIAAADLNVAAGHFAYLVLGRTQEYTLFHPGETPDTAQRIETADAAVHAFLSAYRRGE